MIYTTESKKKGKNTKKKSSSGKKKNVKGLYTKAKKQNKSKLNSEWCGENSKEIANSIETHYYYRV